jgi:predicted porin
MQKKIIALAIASAMTVPALAYAEANISGQANMSIDMVNDGNTNSQSNNQLNSNNSRLVIKGSDDLGDGLSAMYQLDTRFNMDTGVSSTPFWGGNNYVGLKSNSFGTVMLGRLDSPYKSSTRNLDVFFDVAGDNRANSGVGSIVGLLTHDARVNNAIAYLSPNMSGFSVLAASVFGAETATPPPNNKKGQALSIAGMFKTDNIYATLAYDTAKFGNTGTGDLAGTVDNESTAIKLGGGWTMDAFTLNAVIEMPSSKVATTGVKTKNTNIYLGGMFAISGTDKVKLAYTMRGESETGSTKNNDDAKQVAIGYEHGMSKATSVYATYVKTTNNTVGGADPSALSFGVKHAF